MTIRLSHFVGGVSKSGSERTGPVFNPSTGEHFADVELASAAEVDAAVQIAHEAFREWSEWTPIRRARVMFKYRDLVEKNMGELAELVGREHGKTLPDAAGSVQRGLEVVEFACGIPQLLKGEFSEQVGGGIDSFNMRQPLGVCAGITPFNFPAMVPMWMFPVALACGNTFILKPSEKDPSCPIRLAELMTEAGAPPGVLNVVNGDKEAVDALLHHPLVEAVSFVGSTPIAEYIYHTGTANNKRVQALGGAKNHMIIMPDADLDQAADALIGAGFGSAGERCMAVSVAVPVGDETAGAIRERLIPRIQTLKVGAYNDPDADFGPLNTKGHMEKVRGLVDRGVAEGAELVVDGRDLRLQGYENGYFLGGCLFDRVTTDMDIYKQEIFGPVLSMVRAPDYDAALAMVNDHEFGNGTAIFTRDGDAAREFSRNARIGMVGINVPIPVPVAYHSFGGWKRSLFGDHHMHGPEGVRFYTKLKTVTARWPSGIRTGAEFTIPTLN
ncbi:CoA-acylating methylmalonate-semialdehyde dehydrogenase [Alphaproteobacteria bacterium HT1-32]|nr:CoA-acylating methylmalonate-semialdehyde dehydrogenase [Alphaproteobacteria bacterium HT1-32]